MPGCKAYQRGDQWFCDRCGIVWDINDTDPPDCPKQGNEARNRDLGAVTLKNLIEKVTNNEVIDKHFNKGKCTG